MNPLEDIEVAAAGGDQQYFPPYENTAQLEQKIQNLQAELLAQYKQQFSIDPLTGFEIQNPPRFSHRTLDEGEKVALKQIKSFEGSWGPWIRETLRLIPQWFSPSRKISLISSASHHTVGKC